MSQHVLTVSDKNDKSKCISIVFDDLSREDIQRIVRTIMYHYNERIAKRFEELGKEDWAYKENPQHPLWVESRFGKDEGYVNYIYNPQQ
jgi:hypothetical protein